MAGPAGQGSTQEGKARPGQRRSRNGRAITRGCPAFPTSISAGWRAAPGLEQLLRRLCRAVAGRDRTALCLRRPPFARGRRHLPCSRRYRGSLMATQPFAAAHRRCRLAAADGRHRAARRAVRTAAPRSLWRGPPGHWGRHSGRGHCRQQRICAPSAASSRRAGATSTSMPPMSGAVRMAGGGS